MSDIELTAIFCAAALVYSVMIAVTAGLIKSSLNYNEEGLEWLAGFLWPPVLLVWAIQIVFGNIYHRTDKMRRDWNLPKIPKARAVEKKK